MCSILAAKTGFYAGYLGSAYMLGRFVGGYPLGRVADFFGRKPVVVSGLLSIALFSTTFGLSSTFGAAVASRFVKRIQPCHFGHAKHQRCGHILKMERCGSASTQISFV